MTTAKAWTHPPDVGRVSVTKSAAAAVAAARDEWSEIWPRHLKALLPDRSCLTVLDLSNGMMLAIATNTPHTETIVDELNEFRGRHTNVKHNA